jgi:hypothetical protein
MVDHNGTTITVGATVKLVGTVVSINNFEPHLQGCVINPLYPSPNTVPLENNVQVIGQQANPTGLPCQVAFDGSQLIVGS